MTALSDSAGTRTAAAARPHWMDDWRPDDRAFRDAGGVRIARRNLTHSIL